MRSSNDSDTQVATIHGLRLHTPFEIWPGATAFERHSSHELRVTLRERSCVNGQVTGTSIAQSFEHGELTYTFARSGSRTEFMFPGLCHGFFDLDRGQIEVCSDDLRVAKLVLPNTVLAALLGELGDLALHASAVHLGGNTLAFCGPSNAGKTTCAAALCSMDAVAVTDDMLRVELGLQVPLCFPGIPEFRLRATHGWDLTFGHVRTLADDRTGFTPQRIEHAKTPLGAILFPVTSNEGTPPTLRRVHGEAAARRLLQSTRLAWAPEAGLAFLRKASSLAKRVPLFELQLELAQLRHRSYRERLADTLRALGKHTGSP